MKEDKIPKKLLNMKLEGKCQKNDWLEMGTSGQETCHTEGGKNTRRSRVEALER
jgi:hypothetical protein